MKKLINLLNITVLFITISSAIGVITGALPVYSYLNFINYTEFSIHISEHPFIFIFSSTFTLLFIFLIFLCLCAPILLVNTLNKRNLYLRKNNQNNDFKNLLFYLLFSPVFWVSLSFISYINEYSKKVKSILSIFIFLNLIIISFLLVKTFLNLTNKKRERSNWKNQFTTNNLAEILFLSIISSFATTVISFLSFNISLFYGFNNKTHQLLSILFLTFIIIFNNYISYLYSFGKKTTEDTISLFTIPASLTILYSITIIFLTSFFIISPLESFKIIESKPKWYIIESDPQFNFEEQKSISKYSIRKLKNYFRCNSEKCNTALNSNKHALYGYMAWNSGDKKIFCPPDVQFGLDNERNIKISEMCLFIESKFIKPFKEIYSDFDDLSTPAQTSD